MTTTKKTKPIKPAQPTTPLPEFIPPAAEFPVKRIQRPRAEERAQRLEAIAQGLGLGSRQELERIVLSAFIDLYQEEDGNIMFPLMLQQVEWR